MSIGQNDGLILQWFTAQQEIKKTSRYFLQTDLNVQDTIKRKVQHYHNGWLLNSSRVPPLKDKASEAVFEDSFEECGYSVYSMGEKHPGVDYILTDSDGSHERVSHKSGVIEGRDGSKHLEISSYRNASRERIGNLQGITHYINECDSKIDSYYCVIDEDTHYHVAVVPSYVVDINGASWTVSDEFTWFAQCTTRNGCKFKIMGPSSSYQLWIRIPLKLTINVLTIPKLSDTVIAS